jgi:hypothetical protein
VATILNPWEGHTTRKNDADRTATERTVGFVDRGSANYFGSVTDCRAKISLQSATNSILVWLSAQCFRCHKRQGMGQRTIITCVSQRVRLQNLIAFTSRRLTKAWPQKYKYGDAAVEIVSEAPGRLLNSKLRTRAKSNFTKRGFPNSSLRCTR